MTITIPAIYDTPIKKIAYLHRLKDKGITVYNRMGTWYRDGNITLAQYNNLLPQIIKNLYPYEPQLNQSSWLNFRNRMVSSGGFFSTLEDLMFEQIKLVMADTTITIDIDTDVTL